MAQPNVFLLAADSSAQLLPILRSNRALASSQDNHGYSLLHAAASYNHADLLRTLLTEFHVDVNLRDEDGETALFVTETVEIAQILVDEGRIDTSLENDESMTAEEKIRREGDFTVVADYLQTCRTTSDELLPSDVIVDRPPPLPPGITMNLATATEQTEAGEPDPELRRRIEALASRDDFQGQEAQEELRTLIKDAVTGMGGEERDVRRRVD